MPNTDMTRIAGNIGALNALNSLWYINTNLSVHQNRLATGKRISEAADDPAGMVMGTTFDIRRTSLKTVIKAIGDGKSLLAVAEGGVRKINEIMIKMKSKVLEAIGDTLGPQERAAVNQQLTQYAAEIQDIADQTKWADMPLLINSGSPNLVTPGNAMQLLTTATGDTMQVNISDVALDRTNLHILDASLDVSNITLATAALANIDFGLTIVKSSIGEVGAFSARLNFKEDQTMVQYTNAEAAYNRIMNANMAEEQVEASKYMILQQTATAMLAQANNAPQYLLSLFR